MAGWVAGGGLASALVVIVGAFAANKAEDRRSNRQGDDWRAEIRERAAQPGYAPAQPGYAPA